MRRTHRKILFAVLAALLLAAGCGSEDEDETAAVQYKVLGGRLVWCSGGAEEMAVPDNASSIGNNAFGNCGSIGTLTIPASVTHIMRHTFSCVGVGKIIFGGTVGEWAAMAEQDGFGETLDGTPVICSDGEWRWTAPAVPDVPVKPSEWQIEGGVLVRYTGSAADVTIPENVTAIGDGAFEGCAGITHVTIPSGVTSIGENAFKNCEKLTGIEIPGGVTVIGKNAFDGCTSLTNIDIPASVETVGAGALPVGTTVIFRGTADQWDELTEDGEPDGITVFIIDENGTLTGYRGSVTNVEIPDGVKGIASGVFAGNDELKRVVIPAGVTAIAPGAFDGSGITEIEYNGTTAEWDALVEAGGIAAEVADITVECANGTWTPAHIHAWGETYTNGGEGGHYKTCTECDEHSATEAHTYGGTPQADDDGGHYRICTATGCGARSETEPHDYTYADGGNTTHTMTCPTCNYTKSEPHAYGGETYTDAGHVKTCTKCEHSETTPHTWGDTYTDGGTGGHYKTCTTARCGAHSETEAHAYGNYTDDKNGKHYQVCSVCHGHSEAVAHSYGTTYTDDENGKHYQTCSVCSGKSEAVAHTYGTTYIDDENGKHYQVCSVCGGQSEAVAHTYGDYTDDKNGKHYQTCTAAGCNAKSATEPHDCEYKDNGDDTHTTTCTKCAYSDTEEHHYKDGACEVCKCPQPTTVYAASTGSDDNSGSRTKPFATIQKAVDAIIARNDGTSEYTICIDGTLTQSMAGANGMADFSKLTKNLTLTIKALSGMATLDGGTRFDSDGTVTNAGIGKRVIYAKPTSGILNLTLENLVIKGGNSSNDNGGGVYVASGTVTIKDCEISGNTASENGGGVYVAGGGTFTMNGGTISGNTAGAKGGGIYNNGGTVKMKGCTITDCKAGGTSNDEGGGGIYNASGTLELTGVTITLDSDGTRAAYQGGGIFNAGTLAMTGGSITGGGRLSGNLYRHGGGIYNTGVLTIEGVTISNFYTGNYGGGIYNNNGETAADFVTIKDCIITDCGSEQVGSGICTYKGKLKLENVDIIGGTANTNTGIYCYMSKLTIIGGKIEGFKKAAILTSSSGELKMDGTTVSGNTSTSSCGGVDVHCPFEIKNCTITGNETKYWSNNQNGGGLYIGNCTGTITNTTISGNTASADGGGIYIFGTADVTITDCIIKDNTATTGGGGGIYIDDSTATLKMEGGEISGNTAGGDGGGVYINGGTFTMEDGTISGNTAGGDGGGVYKTDSGTFTHSGGTVQSD